MTLALKRYQLRDLDEIEALRTRGAVKAAKEILISQSVKKNKSVLARFPSSLNNREDIASFVQVVRRGIMPNWRYGTEVRISSANTHYIDVETCEPISGNCTGRKATLHSDKILLTQDRLWMEAYFAVGTGHRAYVIYTDDKHWEIFEMDNKVTGKLASRPFFTSQDGFIRK
jgi:hypothetical protein